MVCLTFKSLKFNKFFNSILLHFNHSIAFDLGPKQLCADNFLEVTENESSRRFCGSDRIAQFKTKTNVVTVRFKSGRNFAGSGWILSFEATHDEENT